MSSPRNSLTDKDSTLPQPSWSDHSENPKGKNFVKGCLSFLGLFFLLSIYIGLGAYLFVWIEGPLEENRYQEMLAKGKELEENIDFIAKHLTDIQYNFEGSEYNCYERVPISRFRVRREQFSSSKCFNFNLQELEENNGDPFCQCLFDYKKSFELKASRLLEQFSNYIVHLITDYGYAIDDKNNYIWNWDWTLANSLLFTMTSLTLIGYGHISPSTESSQMALMIYVVLGLPIMMVFLANIGGSLAEAIKYIYSRLCCRWCRVRRRVEEEGVSLISIRNDLYGLEEYMPSNEILVPIVITLLLMGLYIVAGAAVYSSWEGWSLLDAAYFSFITLTTIGFGDFVPGESFLSGDSPLFKIFRILFTSLYCLIGLALISTGISLVQEHVVNKAQWAAANLGLGDEDESPQDKIIISLSTGVRETPGIFEDRLMLKKRRKIFFEFDELE